jgi:proline dehydrogenase
VSFFNKLVVATMPLIPKRVIQTVARRYIAGPHLQDAVRVTQRLQEQGATSTIDVLGEFVTDAARARHEAQMSADVLRAIRDYQLSAYLSVKLTSLGLDIDRDFAYDNVRTLVRQAAADGLFVRMDMENTPYTDITLEFYKRLRNDGFDNVGVVLQAYLYRTEADVQSLLEYSPSVRLCKGIYVEDASVAIKDPDGIRANYMKLLRLLLDGGARTHIATHDEPLIVDAERALAERKTPAEQYEFQMLLGVREDRRDALLAAGHAVRIYVPFGEDWYGYSTRRLKENPAVAGYVAKAIFTGR